MLYLGGRQSEQVHCLGVLGAKRGEEEQESGCSADGKNRRPQFYWHIKLRRFHCPKIGSAASVSPDRQQSGTQLHASKLCQKLRQKLVRNCWMNTVFGGFLDSRASEIGRRREDPEHPAQPGGRSGCLSSQ